LLELKLIADVGIIGLPNAGKSTLISKLTKAKPKIADYPFTTLSPVLGVMELEDTNRIALADIPGLIEGASQGKGLGLEFLRHIERTKLLLHLVDVSDQRQIEPLEAFQIVNSEMEKYNPKLLRKKQIVVGTKIDILSDRKILNKLKKEFAKMGYMFIPVSSITGEGLDTLKKVIIEQIKGGKDEPLGYA